MAAEGASRRRDAALVAVKAVHTLAWAFFTACILAIPLAAWHGRHAAAQWLLAGA